MRLLKPALTFLLAATTGCQPPLQPMQPLDTFSAEPVQDAFGIEAAPAMPVNEIIVRFKDSLSADVPGMARNRSLLLPRTHVFRLPARITMDQALLGLRRNPRVEFAEPNAILKAFSTPNDPSFSNLWGTQKIQAPSAWDMVTASSSVLVAVLDTGVNYNHPDLNAGQVVNGPDLVNYDADSMDDHGHGTHVAGTISATGNNGVGICGVAYGTRVLAIKVLNQAGSGYLSAIADGIIRAQQMGARVINLSLGGTSSSYALQQAVDQVTAAGSLVVAAAGNANTNAPAYPAYYANALAVGATDQNDVRAPFSNYGTWVDTAAPGVSILSTTGGAYQPWNGTSMAAPHVAGVAALLLAKIPSLSVAQLRQAVINTGNPATGFGNAAVKRVNVVSALNSIASPTPTPTPTATPFPTPTPTPTPPTPAPTATPYPTPTPTPTPSAGDRTAPVISSPSLRVLGATSVALQWITNEPADSQVEYGRVLSVGVTSPLYTSRVTAHSVTLTGLSRFTPYFCRLRSRDAAGNLAVSGTFYFAYL